MTPKDKAVAVVSRLTRLTKEGQLSWRKAEPPGFVGGASDQVVCYYETDFQGRPLAIFEARSPHFDENEHCWWDDYVGLIALDHDRNVAWRFPPVAGMRTLLEAVQFEVGNIGELLDELLKE